MKNRNVKITFDRIISYLFIVVGAVGCVFFTVCMFALLAALFSGESDIFAVALMFVMIGFGKMLYDKGIKRRNILQIYALYKMALSGKSEMRLNEVSYILDRPSDQIETELNLILHSGYADAVYIGDNNNRIICIAGTKIIFSDDVEEEKQNVAVKCYACGGISRIPKGLQGKCDYCGSKIQG